MNKEAMVLVHLGLMGDQTFMLKSKIHSEIKTL